MGFVTFMASRLGRWLRIGVGAAMVVVGFLTATMAGYVVALVGLLPLFAGLADVCVLGPLFGKPLTGPQIRGAGEDAPLFHRAHHA